MEKHEALNAAEAEGIVADNMHVRMSLMAQVYSGYITLIQAQQELKKIKSNAKKDGKITRSQAFSRG